MSAALNSSTTASTNAAPQRGLINDGIDRRSAMECWLLSWLSMGSGMLRAFLMQKARRPLAATQQRR
jgi:hypothetical protein